MAELAELVVARLLQNPLGQVAPAGQRGDMVRVSDGQATVYLDPAEFDRASEDDLRVLLAVARREARAAREAQTVPRVPAQVDKRSAPGRAGSGRVASPGSLTTPKRTKRAAERLW